MRQYIEERPSEIGAATFDKEDALAVDFVMAAANLRAAAYGIPMQTWFAVKVCTAGIVAAAVFRASRRAVRVFMIAVNKKAERAPANAKARSGISLGHGVLRNDAHKCLLCI